jgi:hypothetical protein
MKTISNYALLLPASLKREIGRTAAADGTTINQFIVSAAAEKLSARPAPQGEEVSMRARCLVVT